MSADWWGEIGRLKAPGLWGADLLRDVRRTVYCQYGVWGCLGSGGQQWLYRKRVPMPSETDIPVFNDQITALVNP